MGNAKRLDVQGLRALAILFVVLYHGHLGLRGGFIGVDVFFVISGFVITTTLVRELERTGSLSVRGFYLRRIRRILPALAVMLSGVVLVAPLLAPIGALHITSLTALFASVFGANWYLASLPDGYFSVDGALDPLLHTWSLAVEEQMYLVYPVLLLVAWYVGRRLGNGRLVAVGAVAIGTAASVDLAVFWNAHSSTAGFYSSPARAWEFGAGALVALLVPAWQRLPQLLCSAIGAASVAVLLASTFDSPDVQSLTIRLGVPVLATSGLIIAGSRVNLVSAVLSRPPITALGDMSYSLYLWHWPVIVFAHALLPAWAWAPRLGAVASLAPAAVSYRVVENPIRRRAIRGRPALVLAAACLSIPVATALVMMPISFVKPTSYAPQFHEDFVRGCDGEAPLGDPSRKPCNFSVRNARGVVVLIGDSNAGQFTEPVVAAAKQLHLDLRVVTFSRCLFVPLRFLFGAEFTQCETRNAASLAVMKRMRPNLVVVAGRSDSWINDTSVSVGYGKVPLTAQPSLKERLYEEALHHELVELSRRAVPVVLVHPVPLLDADEPGCASVLLFFGGCSGSISRHSVDLELTRAVSAETEAARGVRHVTLLDFENAVCGATKCSARQHGVPMYRNVNHLSVIGSETLTPAFVNAIKAHYRRAAAR